jgi:hypothetical protein
MFMKTLMALCLFVFTTLTTFSQVIVVEMKNWCDYEHSQKMTLHTAMEMDSVTTTNCWKGSVTITFNLDYNKIIIIDTFNKMWVYNVIEKHPTESLINLDAEFDGKYYNFVVSENLLDKMSLIIQNFEKQNDKSVGTFSNEVSYVVK